MSVGVMPSSGLSHREFLNNSGHVLLFIVPRSILQDKRTYLVLRQSQTFTNSYFKIIYLLSQFSKQQFSD